ncbi:MAG TPA: ABC transporter substrate-binding protein [Acetobacteraceae bacterium]|nr:ABC transporter substrate-binding protein [Acetobacteraceae bacterium]
MNGWTRRGLLAGTAGLTASLATGPGRAVAQAPKRGGTITVALVQAPPSLDAQLTSAQVARDINLHMYETLYARDEHAGVVPDLAQSGEISKDGMTYVFTLRPGVKFHNGKTMDSGDVAASLERYRKIGLAAVLLNGVDKIEASGPLEVTVRLKKVQSNFLDTLSSPGTPLAIYPAEEARKDPKDFKFIGTGPMKFVEYAPDSHATLERFGDYVPNPNYSKRDGFAGHKEVFIDRAVFRFMPESGARSAAIETGEVLINETTDGPTAKKLAGNSKVQVLKLLPFGIQLAKFNHAQAPCDDVNFRRAVAACLNMEETLAIAFPDIYKLDGGLLYGYSPYYSKAGTELYNLNDPEKAKGLLAKSSYKGEMLTFITDNTRPDMDTATDIKEQLGQIGIKIEVKVSDWPTVSTMGFKPNGWHFWTHGLGIEPYEGPAKLMSIWTNGISQIKDDPVIDKQYADLLAELDMNKRKEIFAQFQTHMYQDAVTMALGNYGMFQVVSSRIKNFAPYRIPRLWGVWLEG